MRAIRVFTIGYVALMCAWFALWQFTADDLWWMSLINHAVPCLFVPLLVLAMWAFAQRSRAGFALLAPVLIFSYLHWPYLLPQPARTGESWLRVMTYNILFSNENIDGIATAIQSQSPDLVALQEVQPWQMAVLQERLSKTHPHSLIADEHPYGTTAIFSRFPFAGSRIIDTQADRNAVLVRVSVDGVPVQFITAHFLAFGLQWIPLVEFPERVEQLTNEQLRQSHIVRDEALAFDGISILACDCNARETSQPYRDIESHMANAIREIGWSQDALSGGTHLANDLQRLDHIFYRGAIRPIAAYASDDQGGSDHAPIVAVFARR